MARLEASTIVDIIKSYDGKSCSGQEWTNETEPLLRLLPAGQQKLILCAKLKDFAKLRVATLPADATVNDILLFLRDNFRVAAPNPNEILDLQQSIGQSAQEYADCFQVMLAKVNSSHAGVINERLSRSMFVKGLLPSTRKTVQLLAQDKDLNGLIALAKTVESTSNTPNAEVLMLDRRLEQVEHLVKSRKRKATGRPTFNDRGDDDNYEDDENDEDDNRHDRKRIEKKTHYRPRCLYCNRMGHLARNCFKRNNQRAGFRPNRNNYQHQPRPQQVSMVASSASQLDPITSVLQPLQQSINSLTQQLQLVSQPVAQSANLVPPIPAIPVVRANPNSARQLNNADWQYIQVTANPNESLLSVLVAVGNQIAPLVIDSGCTTSVCSEAAVQRYRLQTKSTNLMNFKMADGNQYSSSQMARLPVDGWDAPLLFYILPIPFDFIVGLNILNTRAAVLDFEKRTLKLSGTLHHLVPMFAKREDTIFQISSAFAVHNPAELFTTLPECYPEEKSGNQIELNVNPSLPQQCLDKLNDLLNRFKQVFMEDLPVDHRANMAAHRIILTDQQPFKLRPYRMSPMQMVEARRQVDRLLQKRIIEPSVSPYLSPIVMVGKKDGSQRFCVDYRMLNKKTLTQAAHIPRIESRLQALGGNSYFSTLDLTMGYHQLEIHPDSRHLTSFSIDGSGESYQFIKLPFGMKNAPVIFSQQISRLISFNFAQVYIDDVIVFSKTFDEHIDHLEQVLNVLDKNNIILKPKKCHFGGTSCQYLGHSIDQKGVHPSNEKVKVVSEFPTIITKKQLKSFLGLASFYRRFVPLFAQRCKHLYALTSDGTPFTWSTTCQEEFDDLKKALSEAFLAHPDFTKPFTVHTDASEFCIGGAIHQHDVGSNKLQPLAFYSRLLTAAEIKYSVIEKEALALTFTIERGLELLAGRPFTVYSDNAGLVAIFKSPSKHNNRIARYALRLAEYSFIVHYIPTARNVVADFLSRYSIPIPGNDAVLVSTSSPPSPPSFFPWTIEERPNQNDLRYHQGQDARLSTLPSKPRFFIEDGIIFYKFIPAESDLVQKLPVIPRTLVPWILSLFHDVKLSGHVGYRKMLANMRRSVWFPGLTKAVKKYVASCESCQMRKHPAKKQTPLRPIYIPQPLQLVHADLIGPLPTTTEGFKYVLVIRDNFSRYIVLKPVKDKTAESICYRLVEFIGEFGLPYRFLTDQGREFVNKSNKLLCQVFGIQRSYTSAYHPQSNGTAERANSVIHNILSIYLKDVSHTAWNSIIPFAAYVLNTTVNPSLGFTPYQILFGHFPRLPGLDEPLPQHEQPADHVHDLLHSLQRIWKIARKNRIQSNQNMVNANQPSTQGSFAIGQLVRIFSFTRISNDDHKHNKWLPRWDGPYIVKEIVSPSNLRVTDSHHNLVVHINRVRPFETRNEDSKPLEEPEPQEIPLEVAVDPELVPGDYEVEKVITHKKVRGRTMYLVKWLNFPSSYNTWEPQEHMSPNALKAYNERIQSA